MRQLSILLAAAALLIALGAPSRAGPWDACINNKDPDAAIVACTKIINARGTTKQNRAVALFDRGMAYQSKGMRTEAIQDYTNTIALDPGDPSAYGNRGNLYADAGEYERAIADMTAAIGRDAKNPLGYNNRGTIFGDNKQYERAIQDYDAAIALDPNYAAAYGNRANSLLERQRYDDAIADATKALSLDPDNFKNYGIRGRAYEARGDHASAIADFKKGLIIAPNSPMLVPLLAKAEAARDAADAAPASAPPGDATAAAKIANEKRVALVIGNGRYTAVPSLDNPPRDADAVAAELRDLGFTKVTLRHDLTREDMTAALRDFADDAEHADWAVVYYAGHGIEFDGTNYLIPVDAKLKTDRDIDYETVDLSKVLKATESASKLHLVLLDACRDNPFEASMRRTSATRGVATRGLARVDPDGGTLVVYAAKAGETAQDGGGGANSPFVAALVKRMQVPNLEINKLFRLVHDDVRTATHDQQEPFTYGSLPGQDFYFKVSSAK